MEKITSDSLTEESVSVVKQTYIEHSGQQYLIGQPHRKSYSNSIQGRGEVENEVPEQQRSAIFSVWGNAPTVMEEFTP